MNLFKRMLEKLHRDMYATNHEMAETTGINNIQVASRYNGSIVFAPEHDIAFDIDPWSGNVYFKTGTPATPEFIYQAIYRMTADGQRYYIYPERYQIKFEDVDSELT